MKTLRPQSCSSVFIGLEKRTDARKEEAEAVIVKAGEE